MVKHQRILMERSVDMKTMGLWRAISLKKRNVQVILHWNLSSITTLSSVELILLMLGLSILSEVNHPYPFLYENV